MTLLSWYQDIPSATNFIDPVFHSKRHGNGGNRSFYSSKFVDAAIARMYTGDQNTEIRAITSRINKDAPWIFLWSVHENYAVSPKAAQFGELENFL